MLDAIELPPPKNEKNLCDPQGARNTKHSRIDSRFIIMHKLIEFRMAAVTWTVTS